MDVRKTIGWNLRVLRVSKGMSQEQLALAASVDRSYVGRVERGSENVSVGTLEILSSVLGVHVSQFFNAVDDDLPEPATLPSGRKPKS